MPLQIDDFPTMVSNILSAIEQADIGYINREEPSVVRTIVEAICAVIFIQNQNIEYLDQSMSPETATDEALDNILSIFTLRNQPTKATGVVRFGRSTAYVDDIAIPYNAIVSTPTDMNGDVYEFIVTDTDAKLESGSTYVDVNVEAINPGAINVAPDKVSIMNSSIIGIQYVTNPSSITGGTDTEADASYLDRARSISNNMGKGTLQAIVNAVLEVDGVLSAFPLDMSRGVGTADIVVSGASNPLPTEVIDDVEVAIANTKAAGIDVGVVQPTIVSTDVTITLTLTDGADGSLAASSAGSAIVTYMSSLGVGQSLILHQMNRYILQSDASIIDVVNTAPSANVTAGALQIIRPGTITINGVVWDA